MGALLNTPSQGKSEVLETLHYQGAIHAGIALFRVGPMVSNRYGGGETREGSDPVFEADIVTVLHGLATAGQVTGTAADGTSVDLTSGTPAGTVRVALTGSGRVAGRAPRPRPRRIAD